jgi:hypothetical protein
MAERRSSVASSASLSRRSGGRMHARDLVTPTNLRAVADL